MNVYYDVALTIQDNDTSGESKAVKARALVKESLMRVVIIGGSGHVGTYLVPRLVEAGHEVVNVSRGRSEPYRQHAAWRNVAQVVADRAAEEADGLFGRRVRDLRPDVVVDMICFEESSARHLVEALRGQVQHLLHCGTIWIHGSSVQVPTTGSVKSQAERVLGTRKRRALVGRERRC